MRRMIITALGVVLSLSVPARADDQSRLAVAQEVVRTAHMADMMRNMLPMMLKQMRPLLAQQGASDPKMLDEFIGRFSSRFDQQVDGFVGLAAEVYAREFSEDDLNNLLAFYKSPTGQRMVSKQPEITQGMAAAGQRWGQIVAKEVIEDYLKEKKSAAPKL